MKKKRNGKIGIPWLITTSYAATDEFHQLFVPGRSGQITDVMIDSCGAIVGVVVALAVCKFISKMDT